jgi:hypothetical protein
MTTNFVVNVIHYGYDAARRRKSTKCGCWAARPAKKSVDMLRCLLDAVRRNVWTSRLTLNCGNHAMRMSIETLNAAFYRQRALECLRLADAAQAAKPLFTRLYFLAKAYEEKAKAADTTR